MTTAKQQLLRACEQTKDDPNTLIILFQTGDKYSDAPRPVQRAMTPDDLPADEYDAGYGGTEGPAMIAFSEKYVYISVQYDGAEWMEAIPRHPEYVTAPIPWPGG